MTYIEAFVAAVPTKDKEKYTDFCKKVNHTIKKYGASEVIDCWGEDVPEGKVTSFPMAVKLQEGETVACSWIIWPDKETREKGNKLLMEDPIMNDTNMPMNLQTIIFGGFEKLDNS